MSFEVANTGGDHVGANAVMSLCGFGEKHMTDSVKDPNGGRVIKLKRRTLAKKVKEELLMKVRRKTTLEKRPKDDPGDVIAKDEKVAKNNTNVDPAFINKSRIAKLSTPSACVEEGVVMLSRDTVVRVQLFQGKVYTLKITYIRHSTTRNIYIYVYT